MFDVRRSLLRHKRKFGAEMRCVDTNTGAGEEARVSPRSPSTEPSPPLAALAFRRKIRSNGLDHTLHAFDDATGSSLAKGAVGFRSGFPSNH
jgi:hypothetical protein